MQPQPIIAYKISTGRYSQYQSISEASTKLKIDVSSIWLVLNNRFKQAKGYCFVIECVNYKEVIASILEQPCKRGQWHKRKVIASDSDGNSQVYDSVAEAANTLQVSRGTVSLCCNGSRKHKHFTFQYLNNE